jgi:hypothetical protein
MFISHRIAKVTMTHSPNLKQPYDRSTKSPVGIGILPTCLIAGVMAQAQPQVEMAKDPRMQPCSSGKNEVSVWVKDQYCHSGPNQVSFFANVARDTVPGFQFALVANIAAESVHTQVSGSMNYAQRVNSQWGWNVNIARHVNRLQWGGLNIADTVNGAQIGFVNISKRIEGTGLGLITLSQNGLFHLNLSSEETGMGHITFASGHKWYTAFDVGYTVDQENHPYSLGVGLGRHWPVESGYFETEAFMHMIADRHTTHEQWKHHGKHGGFHELGLNHLLQAKLRIGKPLFGHIPATDGSVGLGNLGVYAGVSFNALLFGDGGALMGPWSDQLTGTSKESKIWPGIEIGIRLGR